MKRLTRIIKSGFVYIAIAVALITAPIFSSTEVNAFSGGNGTSGDPYLITTPAELASLNSYLGNTYNNTYFRLENDIDLGVSPYNTETGWTPIGTSNHFMGSLDGNNKTISNLFINKTTTYSGLFGVVNQSNVYDLTLSDVSVTGSNSVGGFSGAAWNSELSNITVSGDVSSTSGSTGWIGGIIGDMVLGTGTGLHAEDIAVTATSGGSGLEVGGAIGLLRNGTVVDSSATGTVTSSRGRTGGFVGEIHSDSASNNVVVRRSFADVSVTGTIQVGGFVGPVYGLTGSSIISDSYARGNVVGTNLVGGFYGSLHSTGNKISISNSYSTGTSSLTGNGFGGNSLAGALVSNNFWDTQTSGDSTSGGGVGVTGKNTIEMKDVSTFTNTATSGLGTPWDFSTNPNNDVANDDYWDIDGVSNDGYPYLLWQDFSSPPSVETGTASDILLNSAQLNGELTDEGTQSVDRRGFVWSDSTVANPGLAEPEASGYDEVWDDGNFYLGEFNTDLSELQSGTTYYYRAFAQSEDGITYGDQVSFTTLEHPLIGEPVTGNTYKQLTVGFSSYSNPLSGTYRLILSGDHSYTLMLDDLFAGSHEFEINPSNVLASPQVVSSSSPTIEDGEYTLTVEYQDLGSGVSLSSSTGTFTVDATAPAIESLSPVSGTTGVDVDSDLSIQFDEPVGAASGDLVIYNAEDDSIFESIPAGGGPISGNGSDTITINPVGEFEPGNDYYVLMDEGMIRDLAGNDASAITDASYWSFTAIEPPHVLCEQPSSTHESITGHCATEPEGWGDHTWEARYKLASDISYTNIDLEDESQAQTTVDGLNPESDYYLEFRFTNDWGTGDWARLEISTEIDPDIDGDGILNTDEDSGPNDGDANDDGTPDSEQANVLSYNNPVSGNPAVFSTDCESIENFQIGGESADDGDDDYQYPFGLASFHIICENPGDTATIQQHYYGVDGSDAYSVRKWGPDNQYRDIPGSQNLGQPIGDDIVFLVQYQITDGGEFDDDGVADGRIVDPSGAALAEADEPSIDANSSFDDESNLAETGINAEIIYLTISGFIGIGLVFTIKLYDTNRY